MTEISNLISSVGFPIAVVMGISFFGYKKVWPLFEKTLITVTDTNKQLSDSNKLLSERVINKLDIIERNVTEVKEEVRKVQRGEENE